LVLAVKEWIEHFDFASVASRNRKIMSYPKIISSCLKLIEKHWVDLEGRQVAILCNPANTDDNDFSEVSSKDCKMLGLSLFLTFMKHNWTSRLIYHDPSNATNEAHQTIDEVKDQIHSMLKKGNNPAIVINAWVPDGRHKDTISQSIFEGVEDVSNLVYITCWGYNDSKIENCYDLSDLEY
jgi:Icc-related predicted phosphoesterase